jgi:adenylate cyclase
VGEEGFKRKLIAVLSADVAGYSRLLEEEDMTTVRNLREYQKVIAGFISQYRGRVVDSPGDNLLAEFKSAVDAVQCAVEIQRELTERNAKISESRKMEYRIGVNLGDVIQE